MRPTRHFGHMGAAASYVKTNARFELVCEADRLQSRQVGSHDPHKLFMNVLAGKERRFVYCLGQPVTSITVSRLWIVRIIKGWQVQFLPN